MRANRSGAVFRPLSGDQTCFANRTEIPIMKGLVVQGRAKPEMVIVRRWARPGDGKGLRERDVHGWPGLRPAMPGVMLRSMKLPYS